MATYCDFILKLEKGASRESIWSPAAPGQGFRTGFNPAAVAANAAAHYFMEGVPLTDEIGLAFSEKPDSINFWGQNQQVLGYIGIRPTPNAKARVIAAVANDWRGIPGYAILRVKDEMIRQPLSAIQHEAPFYAWHIVQGLSYAVNGIVDARQYGLNRMAVKCDAFPLSDEVNRAVTEERIALALIGKAGSSDQLCEVSWKW